MNKQKGHIGSSFEGFLKEQETLEETKAISIQRIKAWLSKAVKERSIRSS